MIKEGQVVLKFIKTDHLLGEQAKEEVTIEKQVLFLKLKLIAYKYDLIYIFFFTLNLLIKHQNIYNKYITIILLL